MGVAGNLSENEQAQEYRVQGKAKDKQGLEDISDEVVTITVKAAMRPPDHPNLDSDG